MSAWTGREEVEEDMEAGASRERDEAEEMEGREEPFIGWRAGEAVGEVSGLMFAEFEMTFRLRFSKTPSW